MLGRHWERISGRIVASEVDKVRGGGSMGATQTSWKYVVEYTLDGGDPKRVEIKQASGLLGPTMINPSKGQRVPLLLDRKSGDVRFDDDDPAINLKASLKADQTKRDAAFKKKLSG